LQKEKLGFMPVTVFEKILQDIKYNLDQNKILIGYVKADLQMGTPFVSVVKLKQ
jgi:hypothetical protein